MCADINIDGAEATAARSRRRATRPARIRCDVSNPDDADATVNDVAKSHGKLDVLANVAGILQFGHATELGFEEWSRVIAVNLTGVFNVIRPALPHLIGAKGNVVNVASTSGLAGQPYGAAYSASKGGVVLMTKCARRRVRQEGRALQRRVSRRCGHAARGEHDDARGRGGLPRRPHGTRPGPFRAAVRHRQRPLLSRLRRRPQRHGRRCARRLRDDGLAPREVLAGAGVRRDGPDPGAGKGGRRCGYHGITVSDHLFAPQTRRVGLPVLTRRHPSLHRRHGLARSVGVDIGHGSCDRTRALHHERVRGPAARPVHRRQARVDRRGAVGWTRRRSAQRPGGARRSSNRSASPSTSEALGSRR